MSTCRLRTFALGALAVVIATALTVVPGWPANRAEAAGLSYSDDVGVQSNPHGQSCNGPCVFFHSRTSSSITIKWTNSPDQPELSEAFNVRWTRMPLGQHPVTQVDVGGSHYFTLSPASPGSSYMFYVQGCQRHTFAPSSCTPWQQLWVW